MGWQDDPLVAKGKAGKGRPRWESDPIVAAAPVAAAAAPAMPEIDIKPGGEIPVLFAASANPYSAGRYPHGRRYTVGDHATFRESDLLTNVEQRTYTQRITLVDTEADRVEINGGRGIWDLMGNVIKAGNNEFDAPQQFTPAEFQVGKKWTAAFIKTRDGLARTIYFDLHIVRREKVVVPAGSFDAFRIEGQGWNRTFGKKLEMTLWLVPGLNFPVKHEKLNRNRMGRLADTERHELVSLRQQAIGT
jgi:hypothetical protein